MKRYLHWTLLALFTLYLLLVSRAYHVADRRPPTFDDAWYLETGLGFYHTLTHDGLLPFLSSYAGSFRTKAPLISVLPLPFYLVLGTRYHTAILVNFLFIAVTNVYLFLLGRRLFSAGVGLAAVVFYQTMPLAFGLSRVFMPDYGLAALVVMWIYYLVASERFSRGSANIALGVVAGLGLLMKILFPVYVAGPFLVVWWLTEKKSWRPLAAIALPALALAATWYPFHLTTILRYAWQAGYGEIGEQYSGGFARWFVQLVSQGLGFSYAVGIVVLGLAALALNRMRVERSERTGVLLGWLALPLVILAAGRNREIRFLLPVLPTFALLLAACLFRVARRPVAQALLAVLMAFLPLRLFAELSSHSAAPEHHGFEHPLQVGPFIVFGRDLGWARPPDARGDWGQDRVLEALHLMTPPVATRRYVIVGIEHPYLNANLFQYLNAYKNYPLLFNSLGYAETSAQRAVELIYSRDARFLVMGEGFHSHDLVETFNRVNDDIQARLDRGELPFRFRARIPLNEKRSAVIYEREAPWVSFPPGGKAPAPGHPMTVEFAGGVRFLGFDWTQKDQYLSEISYYWTVPHRVGQDYRVNLDFRRGGNVVLVQEHFVTDRRHPFYEWEPGEIVKQTTTVYVPAQGGVEARLWLTSWGVGERVQITEPKELIHQSMIPLRPGP
ncbi:MAG: glycosyltransferase family 39 protein [Acidobacteria bacterium]|nr:glycosyltransferase family 39 protein [Acidobacteriota bacterium]